MMSTSKKMIGALAAATLLGALSGGAKADEIKVNVGGEDVTYKSVAITAMREGVIYYAVKLPGGGMGRETAVPLESLVSLKVDKYPEYAQADELIAKNDLPGAEKLLRTLSAKVTEDYMKLLVGAKLVYVLDWGNKFNDAVKQYVTLLAIDHGPFVTGVRPRNFPKDPAERKKAAAGVEQLMRASADAVVQESLKEIVDALKEDLDAPAPDAANPGSPAAPGALMTPPPPPGGSAAAAPPGAAQPARDPLVELMNTKQYEKAITLIETRIKEGSTQMTMSQMLLIRGQAEQALGREMDAAISFMRVAIHFPRADQAVTALMETGGIYAKAGKTDMARKLLLDAKDRSRDSETTAEIDKRLAALK